MKDIQGYENRYAITEEGQVWSYKSQMFLTPWLQNGYEKVKLANKNYRVHRLVAETYLPNPDKLPEVHHINSIRTDNRVENLAWVSKEDNLAARKFHKPLKWYAEKMEAMGFVFTDKQKQIIENEVN